MFRDILNSLTFYPPNSKISMYLLRQRNVEGLYEDTTSVRRLSNALRSRKRWYLISVDRYQSSIPKEENITENEFITFTSRRFHCLRKVLVAFYFISFTIFIFFLCKLHSLIVAISQTISKITYHQIYGEKIFTKIFIEYSPYLTSVWQIWRLNETWLQGCKIFNNTKYFQKPLGMRNMWT